MMKVSAKCLTPIYPISGPFSGHTGPLATLYMMHNGGGKKELDKFEMASKFVKKAKDKSIYFQSKDPIYKRYVCVISGENASS